MGILSQLPTDAPTIVLCVLGAVLVLGLLLLFAAIWPCCSYLYFMALWLVFALLIRIFFSLIVILIVGTIIYEIGPHLVRLPKRVVKFVQRLTKRQHIEQKPRKKSPHGLFQLDHEQQSDC